ncbi:MAG: hypothetical protein ACE5F2_02145 [Candidatus Paceibacteria bacterium]
MTSKKKREREKKQRKNRKNVERLKENGDIKEDLKDNNNFFTQTKRKIVGLFRVLLTGEVPADKDNPEKSKEESEKEIREADSKRTRWESLATNEKDPAKKAEFKKEAFDAKENLFALKYRFNLNKRKKARRTFWRTVVTVYFVFFFAEAVLSFFSFNVSEDSQMNSGLTLFIFQALYTLASLRQVREDEIGGLSFLGKFILNVDSGLAFSPLGLCRILTVSKSIIVQELPDKAENIFETEKKEPVPHGMSAPMYIISGSPTEENKDDPLNARLTGRATPVVTYRVIEPCDFFQYVRSLDEARERMTDVAAAMLGTEIAKTTYAEVIPNMARYNNLLRTAITRKIDGYSEPNSKPWGIHFEDAWLKPFLFGHELHKSMAQMVESKFNKMATVINAEASAAEIGLKGDAEASVIKNKENALTEALVKRSKDLNIDSDLVYVGEVAGEIAKGNTILAGDEGFTRILGLTQTIATAMKNKKEKGDDEK